MRGPNGSIRTSGFGRCDDCTEGNAAALGGQDRPVERMLRVAHDVPDGTSSWCPSCGQRWVSKEKVDQPGMTYEGLLYPDSTISWKAETKRLTRVQAEGMEESLRHLHHAAREREEHLRGADRWIFGIERGVRRVLHGDDDHALEPFVVRASKHEGRLWRGCAVCRRAIAVGERAYRALPSRNQCGSWRHFRFCVTCVEQKPSDAASDVLGALRGSPA